MEIALELRKRYDDGTFYRYKAGKFHFWFTQKKNGNIYAVHAAVPDEKRYEGFKIHIGCAADPSAPERYYPRGFEYSASSAPITPAQTQGYIETITEVGMAVEAMRHFFAAGAASVAAMGTLDTDIPAERELAPLSEKISIEEFAQRLDGREYGAVITKDEVALAKKLGYVVVFGYSDDCMELRGAIDDEIGCWNGGTIRITPDGVCEPPDRKNSTGCANCKCGSIGNDGTLTRNCGYVTAVWSPDIPDAMCSWIYETNAPCAEFDIFDEEGLYCRGIVFELSAVTNCSK